MSIDGGNGSNEEQAQINEELLEQLREAGVRESELNTLLQNQISLNEKLASLKDSLLDKQEKLNELERKTNAETAAQTRLEEELAKVREDREKRQNRGKANQNRLLRKEQAIREKLNQQAEKLLKATAAQERQQRRVNKATADAEKAQKKLEKATKAVSDAGIDEESVASEIKTEGMRGKIAGAGGMIGGSLGASLRGIGGFPSKIKSLEKSFKGFAKFIPLGKMGKLGQKLAVLGPKLLKFAKGPYGMLAYAAYRAGVAIFNFVEKVDALSKAIGNATGFVSQFHDEIVDIAVAGNMANIGFTSAKNALVSLTEGLSSFLPTNEKTNIHLGLTVARLEKLGVTAGESVKSIDHMQRAMGLNAEEAADLTANVARLGKEVGITAKKSIGDFNKAAPLLARYGKDNIKVFKDLQAQAKATGMSIDSLTSSVSKFDTFEGAAESAAALNAVLGTQLSQLELMNMTEAERVKTIRDQVKASVGNFDSLDKFTKLHITQAMGLKTVDEAQRLLNMSTAEYNDTLQGQKENVNIQAELAKATEELVPITQQIKLAFLELFTALSPILVGFSKFIGFLTTIIPPMVRAVKTGVKFAAIVAMIGGAILAIKAGAIGLIIAGIAKGAGLLFGVLGSLAGAMTSVGTGLAMLKAGFASLMSMGPAAVIGAFSALAGVFGFIYELFSSVINPVFVQIFHYLAIGMDLMMTPLKIIVGLVERLSDKFMKFFLIISGNADQLHHFSDKAFNVEDLMRLDTEKISSGLGKIKSAVAAIGEVSLDGIMMVKPDGTSLIGGSDVIKSVTDGKLEIDVKMSQQSQLLPVVLQIGEKVLEEVMVNLEFAKVDQVASAG